ncbi:MAG: hypothetical protein A2Z16_11255 [Chloroflexi bacterium RBG_16_54_18]|nr:MAG: hypothetical protein A2Z16_11255 [Chloroflexi bacterium RBG_16_54_18]
MSRVQVMRIILTDQPADYQLSPNNRDSIVIPVLAPGRRKNTPWKASSKRQFNGQLFEPMDAELIAFFFDFGEPDIFLK